jgi:hypothetical protein
VVIDLDALKRASEGDQSKKVTVTKAWLAAVHSELTSKHARDRVGDVLAGIGEKLAGLGPKQ